MVYRVFTQVSVFFSVLLIFIYIAAKYNQKKEKYKKFVTRKVTNEFDSIADFFTKLPYPLTPSEDKKNEVKHYLDSLGKRDVLPEVFHIYCICIGIVMGIVYFAGINIILNKYFAIVSIFPGFITGYRMPFVFLKSKFEQMQEEKQMGILPYIEMLQVSTEAGLTLTLAIERIYEYYPTPIALEFKRANNDFMTNIKTRRESLQDIIPRVGGDDIRLLIESIIQSIDTGTPIKSMLKTLGKSIRRELHKTIINRGQQAKWKNFVVAIIFQFPPYIFIIAGPSLSGLMNSLG